MERTHAGPDMKSRGAFSWYLTDLRGRDVNVGSQWTATECLRLSDEDLLQVV